MLNFENVSFSIAGKDILENVSFQVNEKQHIGLVGRNGAGKTTIFRLIEKIYSADSGDVNLERNAKVLAIKQEIPSGNTSVRDYIISQDKERLQLFGELEKEDLSTNRMCEIYDRLIQIDAYNAESRAAVVLNGLGFSEEEQNMPLDNFSGGFKMRIALASVLFQEPDLLLLDEPTNHLDLETVEWLRTFLCRYPRSFILISHDRDFLNSTIDYVFHLKNKKLTKYTGNFEQFLFAYEQKQKNIELFNSKMEEKRAKIIKFVSRFGAKATKAKQAQSKLKMLEKMKFIPIDDGDQTVKFNFPECRELPSPIVTFEKVSLGYGEKIVLKNISGTILNDDKIAIVGANGNGKSTFAKFLVGELKQRRGTRDVVDQLRIGFYNQELFKSLDLDVSSYDHIKSKFTALNDFEIRSHLGNFGFSGEIVNQKIRSLSGGEKARLVFATLTMNSPNLLILDEPTNHLDLEMRESLVSSLTSFNGAVVLISHDQHFLSRVANSIFIIKNGLLEQYNDDLIKYLSSIKR